jgi:hypothetical protein
VNPPDPKAPPPQVVEMRREIPPEGEFIARFGAYVHSETMQPAGTMRLQLGIPFSQVPHVMPMLRHIAGIQFEVTVRRVPRDMLPEPGW